MSDKQIVGSGGPPPHFIVIVPGYMGSKLKDKKTGEIIWVDFQSIPRNPMKWKDWLDNLFSKMAYPNDDIVPAGIMDEVLFVPPWAKQEHYGRLKQWLEGLGYCADETKYSEKDLTVYCFDYDWRQDNRISAEQLGEAIERWSGHHPGAKAWLIAHSNGGIVSRWYIEKQNGKDRVSKLFLMGSPWDGAPKAVMMLFSGLDTLFRRGFDFFNIRERTREVIRTFPSAYQLIPVKNPFLRGLDNEQIDVFSGEGWLSRPEHRSMLVEGKRFNEELGNTLSVDTLCFFGRKLPTTTNGVVRFKAGGEWSGIEWLANEAGDGTVPERSAVNPNATAKLPFLVNHGDIYVNPPVLEFLQWELVDQYHQVPGAEDRAAIITERLQVMFEPEKDTYFPGEEIHMWATVQRVETGEPVTMARIRARLNWRQALPGSEVEQPAEVSPVADLWESDATPGRYEGSLTAPEIEGYYQLQATVQVMGEPGMQLEELIAVEKVPEQVQSQVPEKIIDGE